MVDVDIKKLKSWAELFETKLEIKWEDHQNWFGWHGKEEANTMVSDDDISCEHLGYYAGESKKTILLAQGGSSKNIHNCMQILKKDIISIKEVR